MTDNEFLTAMRIKPEDVPAIERTNAGEMDLTPNVLIDLSVAQLQNAAVNWCNQARAQYQENQVLRTSVRNWRNTSEFLIVAAGLLLIALIAVCGGQL